MTATTEIIRENTARQAKFRRVYNPLTGEGSPLPRKEVEIATLGRVFLPLNMMVHPLVAAVVARGSFDLQGEGEKSQSALYVAELFDNVRLDEDFEYWAYVCGKIKDKETSNIVRYKLNYPQRKLLNTLEVQFRWKGLPIRINVLKARQWGGSTLIHFYFDWFQVRRFTNCNSVIVADVEGQARNIRGMFTRMAKAYPKKHGTLTLAPFEGSTSTRIIKERDCIISVGSMQKPESSRSFDFQLAHLSEVGLWKKTLGKEPKDLVQAVRSGILFKPNTAIIQESTAKGTGNYWYHEWQDSKSGKSGYYPFFVAFWEIELYQETILDAEKFISEINSWETSKRERAWLLWEIGASLEAIKWYFTFKERENYDEWRMMSEFPANDTEAFQSTGNRAFHPGDVWRMRMNYGLKFNPLFTGDIKGDCDYGPEAMDGVRLIESNKGALKLWRNPETGTHRHRYLVSVDIGGTTEKADFSTIRLFDREPLTYGGVLEAIGTWKGHLPQDMVAWKAIQICLLYDNALLVIEQNSLDNKGQPDHFLTVLNEIKDYYPNIYCRTPLDKIREGVPIQYGFHVNAQTKPMIIGHMNQLLRTDGYIEYDDDVLIEYDQYELKENGQYGAVDGAHDDLAMATMEGAWVGYNAMAECTEIDKNKQTAPKKQVASEASF